ncbi:hypothetical protein [Sphingomonas bacterium]|nr:hypothetical protein [Sphingomonas bacterium]
MIPAVIPAKAGTQLLYEGNGTTVAIETRGGGWVPAFAGMTSNG